MAIDKERNISASVVLDKNFYKKIQEMAKENKRTASAQMAYMLEEYYKIINIDKK